MSDSVAGRREFFDELYARAGSGGGAVPWDRGGPNPRLVEWAVARGLDGLGGVEGLVGLEGVEGLEGDQRSAVVVGCGYGFDAEYLAGLGFRALGFDFSSTAIAAARERFAGSSVAYVQADLLATPQAWSRAYDLVFEALTVQSLPPAVRLEAIAAVRELVAPGGTLLVVAAKLRPDEPREPDGPWPLSREDIEAFAGDGLEPIAIEILPGADTDRWRAEFRRNPAE